MQYRFAFISTILTILSFMISGLTTHAAGPMPSEIAESMLSLCAFETSPINDVPYDSEDSVYDVAYSVRPSSVQIQVGDNYGEGSIFSIDEENISILTAAHVLEGNDVPLVIFYSGTIADCNITYIDSILDVAIATVPTTEIDAYDLIHLKTIRTDASSFNEFEKETDPIVITLDSERAVNPRKNQKYNMYGSGTGIAESYMYGTLLKSEILVDAMGYKMLYAKCSAHSGMSGSGVFDTHGNYIGLLNGGTDNDEIIATRLSDILNMLSGIDNVSNNDTSGN